MSPAAAARQVLADVSARSDRPRAFDDLTAARPSRPAARARARRARASTTSTCVRVSFVAQAFNTVFRVDAADGSTYALRVSPNLRIHADGCEAVEAAWVAALRRDAGLADAAGDPDQGRVAVVRACRAPGVPGARSCVLFEWVGGRPLARSACVCRPRARGRRADRASCTSTALSYAHGARRPVRSSADRVLYFRLPRPARRAAPDATGRCSSEAVDRAQRRARRALAGPAAPPAPAPRRRPARQRDGAPARGGAHRLPGPDLGASRSRTR